MMLFSTFVCVCVCMTTISEVNHGTPWKLFSIWCQNEPPSPRIHTFHFLEIIILPFYYYKFLTFERHVVLCLNIYRWGIFKKYNISGWFILELEGVWMDGSFRSTCIVVLLSTSFHAIIESRPSFSLVKTFSDFYRTKSGH